MRIDGSTTIVGIFGAPIKHTASPAMQNAAFAALEMNWVYLAFPVDPQNLRTALQGASHMGLAGINLTIPHKILALDCIDEIDAEARKLGAVNTVSMEKGKLHGYNTDGYGFLRAIKEDFNLSIKGKRVLVLGAGGAGRGIAVKCALDGATRVIVANRTPARIDPIAREVRGTKAEFLALKLAEGDIRKVIHEVDLMVNATSVGLEEGDSLGLGADLFSPRLHVYDTIYRPAKTELLRVAESAGAKVANGLSMLLHQGAKAFEIWTKRKAPLAVMRRALRGAVYGEKIVTGLQLYIDFIVFAFGAVVGSFLNVCIHRMPLDQSIVSPPSHCPHCNAHIRWSDNIPLFGYLALGRKCRNCGVKISPRYFLVELLTAVLFLLMWLKLTQWNNPPVHGIYFLKAPIYWMVIAGLIVATFIDLEHYIIPNEITFGGIVVGLVLSTIYPPLQPDDLLTSSILKLSPIALPACGISFFRSFFGMLTGGLILLSIAEFGKLLFGRLRVPLAPDAIVVIADGKLKLPDEEVPWADLFFRESDKIRFTARSLKFNDKELTDATVIVMENSITINGEHYPLAEAGAIEVRTNEIVIPREAMGFGDVKLLAGIGALLGWEATVFSIFLSSATGAVVGLALIALGKKDLQGRIPYGPYIALGALVWLFAEGQLLAIMAAYLGNIKDLLTMVFSRG